MSNAKLLEKLNAKLQRTDIPPFVPGDTVRVHVKIKEGDKERLQAFEGTVIARTRGPQTSFTVRKDSFGQGVERICPANSMQNDRAKVVRSSGAPRANNHNLWMLKGKSAGPGEVQRVNE